MDSWEQWHILNRLSGLKAHLTTYYDIASNYFEGARYAGFICQVECIVHDWQSDSSNFWKPYTRRRKISSRPPSRLAYLTHPVPSVRQRNCGEERIPTILYRWLPDHDCFQDGKKELQGTRRNHFWLIYPFQRKELNWTSEKQNWSIFINTKKRWLNHSILATIWCIRLK